MKINVIDTKDESNRIDFQNVYLSANNPRYTLIKNIDDDFNKFISNSKYKNVNENFNKLLCLEGDFNELSDLLESINLRGFDNSNEPIYLVKNNNDYIVAEGNRRIMCLKLINDDFKLPISWDFSRQMYQNSQTELEEKLSDDDISDNKNEIKTKDNFNKCRDLIQEIRQKNIDLNVFVVIDENEDKLWKQIYDRHLAGEKQGLRKWSRSKYFADLLNIFNNGIDNNDIEFKNKILNKFNRDWKLIITDFKEAQYIYSCFYFNIIDNEFGCIPDFINLDEDILNKMIYSSRISALEYNHSYNKIVSLICNDILYTTKQDFNKNYLEIKWPSEDNYRIKFIAKNKFNFNKFLSFIFDKWNKNEITTRGFKPEKKNEIINELEYKILKDNIDFENKLTESQLDEINEFSLSIDDLNKLINANSGYHDDLKINRFKLAKQIKEDNKFFIEFKNKELNFKDNQPIHVFDILALQLDHNSNAKNREYFLNAIATTLRTLLEQLLMWMMYASIDTDDDKNSFINSIAISPKCGLKTETKNNGQTKQRKILNVQINDSSLQIALDCCLKNKEHAKNFKVKIMNIFNDHNDLIEIGIHNYRYLNEYVHSIHRIYLSSGYDENLKKLNNFQKFVKELMSETNFKNEYFKEINDKVISIISKKE